MPDCVSAGKRGCPMNGGLWVGHRGRSGITQNEELLLMLRTARAQGKPVNLYEIMAAGIAQHGARFNELRARGFVILNELERSHDGRVLSRYWLRIDPELDLKEPL